MADSNKTNEHILKSRMILISLIILVLTLAGALASTDVQLNESNIEGDILFYNNDTKNVGTMLRIDPNINNKLPDSNSTNSFYIQNASLCMYALRNESQIDDDVQVCRITSVGWNLSNFVPMFECDFFNLTYNTTLSNIYSNNWTCIDVTYIFRDRLASEDLVIRLEDADYIVNETEDNDIYEDLGGLGLGYDPDNASSKVLYFEDEDNSGSSNNTPYINITYNWVPILNNVYIPNIGAEDDLVCEYSASDDDNDNLTTTYAWYKNSVLQSYNTSTISANYTTIAEIWQCNVSVTDGDNSTYKESSSVTIGSGGGGDGGGAPDLPPASSAGIPTYTTYAPEDATFTITPSGEIDLLILPDAEATRKIRVTSTSSSDAVIRMYVTDECGIYEGYDVDGMPPTDLQVVSGYDSLTYNLHLKTSVDYDIEKCFVHATFIKPDGEGQNVNIRVWNTAWSNAITYVYKTIAYPIRFEKDAEFEFLTKEAMFVIPSAINLNLPFIGLAFMIMAYILARQFGMRYIIELRGKKSRTGLFLFGTLIFFVMGFVISTPIWFF